MVKAKLGFILLILAIAISSCEKTTGDDDTIAGGWSCREESNVNDIRQYSVLIDRAGAGFDTSYYVIYNFHNLGQDVETYAQLQGSTLTIRFMTEGYSATGTGYVSDDLKSIDWNYNISGSTITALYYRK